MIAGIGIDAVDIKRFAHWHMYSRKTLSRIFASQEIDYAQSNPTKSAERYASRFAAKEAFYKAFCSSSKECNLSFLTLCRYVSIDSSKSGAPMLIINWPDLGLPQANVLLSITHTSTYALAIVTLEKR